MESEYTQRSWRVLRRFRNVLAVPLAVAWGSCGCPRPSRNTRRASSRPGKKPEAQNGSSRRGAPSMQLHKNKVFSCFLGISSNTRQGALGTIGTLRMALRGPRGRLQEDPGDAGGSLGGPRSALGASSGCHQSGLGCSKGHLEIIKKPLLFERFFQYGTLQNSIRICSEVLEGSPTLSRGPQGSSGRCPGIFWMLRTIQKHSLAQHRTPRVKVGAPEGRLPKRGHPNAQSPASPIYIRYVYYI